MPFFKTTYNILKQPDKDELYHPSQFERDTVWLPPKKDWDYKREMQVEDVDIWEVIIEGSHGVGIYAAWSPYAEFYLITTSFDMVSEQRIINGQVYTDRIWETHYGPGATEKALKRAKDLNLPIQTFDYWVEDDQMWLYNKPEPDKEKIIILPYQ